MMTARIGYGFFHRDARHGLDVIRRAEEAGVPTAWLVMPGLARDSLSVLTAAATQTSRINLGTAIVPAFTRHPVAMATQVMAIEDLAPGRLRLGIGTSHQYVMIPAYGLMFDHPLAQLREYLSVLRPLLETGEVDFAGQHYRAKAKIAFAPKTPLLISALRPGAWELAGELSDGAISWNCPPSYLAGEARAALIRGAEKASRATPPMIAHFMVTFAQERDAFLAAGREALSRYAAAPFYALMFAAAGFPIINNQVSDALIDAFVIGGDDDAIEHSLMHRLETTDEIIVNLIGGDDEENRIFRILQRIAARTGV